jgi:integrase
METLQKKKVKKKTPGYLLSYMEYLERAKYESGKKGTAGLYKATRHQLAMFLEKENLSIKKVNARLVQDFIARLQSLSLSRNSVSNYTSTFRAAYNAAVADNLVKPEEHPFRKLHIKPVSTYKRSVGTQVIKEITRMDLKGNKRLTFARDLFLFSFMACGMAFIDLAHLTQANIRGNEIVYYRIKTKTEIRVTITQGMRYLLDKYKREDSTLLFPVLEDESASYEKYKVALRTYNRRLSAIGDRLSTPVKLTSYVARHSWAMCAKDHALSASVIGQALGHTSEKTTNYYLKKLDQTIISRANLKIIGFVEKLVSGSEFKI